MLEGVELGFDQNKMVFSACRDCDGFREFCFEGNKGFCCAGGKVEDNFIPFDYPLMDKEGKRRAIMKYQDNPLPEDCLFHTQCSMLGMMQDDSAVDEIVADGYEVEETTVGNLDLSDPIFHNALERDASLKKWCGDVKDATAILLKKGNEIHGFAFLTFEKDYDYAWIQPHPPVKHYFQKGDSRIGIRLIYADDAIHNARMILLSLAFHKAVMRKADEIYSIAYIDTMNLMRRCGFKTAGYMLGGSGNDEDAAATVVVKGLRDLENGE